MTARLVLDAEAVQALLDPHHPSSKQLHQAVTAASRTRRDVAVAMVTLAECYRGMSRTAAVDALIARRCEPFLLRETDRALAKLVGALLRAAGRGSEDMADAHVAATAVELGGVVVTGDPRDLEALLGGQVNVRVVGLRDSR